MAIELANHIYRDGEGVPVVLMHMQGEPRTMQAVEPHRHGFSITEHEGSVGQKQPGRTLGRKERLLLHSPRLNAIQRLLPLRHEVEQHGLSRIRQSRTTAATGPKVSWAKAVIPGSTPSSTVGSTNHPGASIAAPPIVPTPDLVPSRLTSRTLSTTPVRTIISWRASSRE